MQKKIVLLGYMASGKSTIGKIVAEKLKLTFFDLDNYIEEREKMKISEIFKSKGEIYFRTKENTYLKQFLEENDSYILALGGGTPCYANNMSLINATDIVSIYLQSNISTLVTRLLKEKNKRPLVANLQDDKIPEFVAKHLFERRYYYEQASETVSLDHKTTQELETEILKLI